MRCPVPASGAMMQPETGMFRQPARRHRVEMVLEFLRPWDPERRCYCARWRSGQQIVEHVKTLSAQIGDQTAYNSSNGAARNARALARSRGLTWWTMDVSRDETGPARPGNNGHRLYCVTRRNEPPPRHRAMEVGARAVGDPPLVQVANEDLERSAAAIAEREMKMRGGAEQVQAGIVRAEMGAPARPAPAQLRLIGEGR